MKELFVKIRNNNIILEVEGENLKIFFEQVAPDPMLIDEIRENKSELIKFLKNNTQHNSHAINRPQIPAVKTELNAGYVLSSAQTRLWITSQLSSANLAYTMPGGVYLFEGFLNKRALEKAFESLIDRHEILRTVFKKDNNDNIHQYILSFSPNFFRQSYFDLSEVLDKSSRITAVIESDMLKPFDLEIGPLMRASLLALGDNKWILIYTMHHIVSDGWSMGLMLKELMLFYHAYNNDKKIVLQALRIQYKDYAIWQQNQLHNGHLKVHQEYWKQCFLDGIESLDLPTDRIRPAIKNYQGSTVLTVFNKKLLRELKIFCHRSGCTIFMGLVTILKALLYHYSGQEDIIIGTPVAGRDHIDLEDQIGFYVNMLALRTRFTGEESFEKLLNIVKEVLLGAYEHQMYPFDELIADLNLERDISRHPLFDVVVVLQNTDKNNAKASVQEVSNLNFSNYEVGDQVFSKFDLTFNFFEIGDELSLSIEYNTYLFNMSRVFRMGIHLQKLMELLLNNPTFPIKDFEYIGETEKDKLLFEFNTTSISFPRDKLIIDLFEEQVASSLQRTAVVYGEKSINYEQLNTSSNKLACFLVSKGITNDTLIPVCMDRSIEMIVAILGILKSGGAYVPIDPAYPEERLDFILNDCKSRLVITDNLGKSRVEKTGFQCVLVNLDTEWEVIETYPSCKLNIVISAGNLAYVIYTSGSTGNPKGVLIEQKNVVRLFRNEHDLFDFCNSDTWVMFHSYCFDFSVWEMYGALLNGGKLVLLDEKTVRDTRLFLELLHKEGVTILNQTPSAFYNLILADTEVKKTFSMLRCVIFGGEALVSGKLKEWKIKYPWIKLINMYGITETTVHVTYKEINEEDIESNTASIGVAIPTLQCYVLGKNMQLLPIGIPGELYVGGDGVARGYLNRTELDTLRFVNNPWGNGTKLYRSGDKVKLLENGEIEYLGRLDEQVKIRGYRIELGEVQSYINKIDEVLFSLIMSERDLDNNNILVCYYLPEPSTLKIQEELHYQNQINSWEKLYDIEYAMPVEISNVEFDITGWKDSFTGAIIPGNHMQEWLEDIIEVVLTDELGQVLEIGCGTGLIYFKIADLVKKYTGIDFSEVCINQLQEKINRRSKKYPVTDLMVCRAHQIPVNLKESFDTIILNSVIQYFPGEKYLSEIIGSTIKRLRGRGRIIIGDVRDLRLLRLFKTRLALDKMKNGQNISDLRNLVDREMMIEEELCFSPQYFCELRDMYPEICYVKIQWKRGSLVNEMSLYRYTVTLYVGYPKQLIDAEWKVWESGKSNTGIVELLTNGQLAFFGIKNMPNPRLWQEKAIDVLLDNDKTKTVEELVKKLTPENDQEGETINQLIAVAQRYGYTYTIYLNEDPLKMDLFFENDNLKRFVNYPFIDNKLNSSLANTNMPLFQDVCLDVEKIIKKSLQHKLPAYMLPQKYIPLQRIPLTRNGKIDYKYLQQYKAIKKGNNSNYEAPTSDLQKKITTIWERLLSIEKIGIQDNFFSLGGDSIRTIRLVMDIRKKLGIEIPVSKIYEFPTIEQLTANLMEHSLEPSIYSELQSGLRLIEEINESIQSDKKNSQKLPDEYEYFYPMTSVEQGMIYSSLLRPIEPVYYDQFSYRVTLKNVELFKDSIVKITKRHSILRTKYYLKTFIRPLKIVFNNIDLPVYFDNLVEFSETEKQEIINDYLISDGSIRLKFDDELLWRLKFFQLNEFDIHLVFSAHHAMLDGWSQSVLLKELFDLSQRELAPLRYDYRHYCAISLAKALSNDVESYWKKILSGYTRNKLPFNYHGTIISVERGMKKVFLKVDKSILVGLDGLVARHQISFKSLFLSAHVLLLHLLSSERDVITGVVTHDRPAIENNENIVGCFLNTIPVRINFDELSSVVSLLKRVAEYLNVSQSKEIHLTQIAKIIGEKTTADNPIFDSLLNYTEFHLFDRRHEGIEFETVELNETIEEVLQSNEMTNTLLDIDVDKTANNLTISIKYLPSLFYKADIHVALNLYVRILECFLKDDLASLNSLELISEKEKDEFHNKFNGTIAKYNEEYTLSKIFEKQVLNTPTQIALRQGQNEMSYSELNTRANQVARFLIEKGVKQGNNIGLLMSRGFEMIIGMYAILKAGAAYVPIDPEYPVERQKYMALNSGLRMILVDRQYAINQEFKDSLFLFVNDENINLHENTNLELNINSHQLAYTIYTSGSTGQPKGVMIKHHSVINLIQWVNRVFEVGTKDSLLFITSMCFDLSVYDIFGILSTGGSLFIVRQEEVQDMVGVRKLIESEKITFWNSVPTTMNFLIDELERSGKEYCCKNLRLIFMSGDWIPVKLPDRIRNFFPLAQIVSLGGATEGTVWSNYFPIEEIAPAWSSIPYGKPIQNNFFYILNEKLQIVPRGVAGELYIGGVGVAQGYANDIAKTDLSFVKDKFSFLDNGRMYKTGDMGRMMPDGNMEFLGRKDNQVKIRGFRVELGEIESVLRKNTSIKEVVVGVSKDSENNNQLCAYLIPMGELNKEDIKHYLRQRLPLYMIPGRYIIMDSFPLNSNGKIDRGSLPHPDDLYNTMVRDYIPPQNDIEKKLVEIWENILVLKNIGVEDIFFDIGGDSIKLLQLYREITTGFSAEIEIADLFVYNTIQSIAQLLKEQENRDEAVSFLNI